MVSACKPVEVRVTQGQHTFLLIQVSQRSDSSCSKGGKHHPLADLQVWVPLIHWIVVYPTDQPLQPAGAWSLTTPLLTAHPILQQLYLAQNQWLPQSFGHTTIGENPAIPRIVQEKQVNSRKITSSYFYVPKEQEDCSVFA